MRRVKDPVLDWLLSLKAAQTFGIGEDDVRGKFLRDIDAGNKAAAQIQTQIQATEAELASLNCDGAGGVSRRTDASPGPSASGAAEGGGSAQ